MRSIHAKRIVCCTVSVHRLQMVRFHVFPLFSVRFFFPLLRITRYDRNVGRCKIAMGGGAGAPQ